MSETGEIREIWTETETRLTAPETETRETDGGTVLTLWTDRETICETLGISRATFYRRLKSGVVESRKNGRLTEYRVVKPVKPRPAVETETREIETETGEIRETGSDERLVEVNDRLSARIAELESENTLVRQEYRRLSVELTEVDEYLVRAVEALARSNGDVRRLHRSLESLLDGLVEVAASPMALPVRRRLRAVLAAS